MDPLGVLTAVGAVGKQALEISQILYRFARDTKDHDQTVVNLATEIETLGDTCNSVRMQLEDIVRQYDTTRDSTGQRSRQWSATKLKLDECRNTLERLDNAIERVRRNSKPDMPAMALQQVRFNMNEDEMMELRARVRFHITALQISLQVIGITVLHLERRYADHALLSKLDALQQKVDTWVAQQTAEHSSWRAENDNFLQDACEVLSQGTTLYERSTAGGLNIGVSAGHRTLHSAARSKVVDLPPGGYSSNFLSPRRAPSSRAADAPIAIFGHSNAPRGRDDNLQIPDWIRSVRKIASKESFFDRTLSDRTPSGSFSPRSLFSDQDDRRTVTTEATSAAASADEDKHDWDDEFEVGVVRQALKLARDSFDAHDYEEANSHLQAAVEMVQSMAPEHQNACDPRELQYLIAACTFHLNTPAEAETSLVAFLENPGTANRTEAVNLCHAGHLLSQVYMRQNKLDLARSACHDAVRGRWKLLGDKDPSYYESLALLSTIYMQQGNSQKSKMYASLIDRQSRDMLIAKFEDLSPPVYSRKASSTTLPSAQVHNLHSDAKRLPPEQPPPTPPKLDDANLLSDVFRSRVGKKDMLSDAFLPKFARKDLPLDAFRSRSTSAATSDFSSLRSAPSENSVATLPAIHPVTTRASQSETAASRSRTLQQLGLVPVDELQEAIAAGDIERANHISVRFKAGKSGGTKPTALHFAALFGELDLAQTLLSNSQVNQTCKINYSFGGKASPLHFAVAGRHTGIIRLLVANGAALTPTKTKTKFGVAKSSVDFGEYYPPALIASKHWLHLQEPFEPQEYIEVVKTMLSLGYDINAPADSISRTLLHLAVRITQDRLEYRKMLVSFLIDQGANVLIPTQVGSIPLHFAARWNETREVIAILLQTKTAAQVWAKDKQGNTVIHDAIWNRRDHGQRVSLDILHILLSAGAPVDEPNQKGETPISLAKDFKGRASFHDVDASNLLVGYGAVPK